jgi:hypothetical protein
MGVRGEELTIQAKKWFSRHDLSVQLGLRCPLRYQYLRFTLRPSLSFCYPGHEPNISFHFTTSAARATTVCTGGGI